MKGSGAGPGRRGEQKEAERRGLAGPSLEGSWWRVTGPSVRRRWKRKDTDKDNEVGSESVCVWV